MQFLEGGFLEGTNFLVVFLIEPIHGEKENLKLL
jgi:hypothetical protein